MTWREVVSKDLHFLDIDLELVSTRVDEKGSIRLTQLVWDQNLIVVVLKSPCFLSKDLISVTKWQD